MQDFYDSLEEVIDELDRIALALNSQLLTQTYTDSLLDRLPEKVERLKTLFTGMTGENPWK